MYTQIQTCWCILALTNLLPVFRYGYIGEFRLRAKGAKLYYTMDYPEEKCCIKILLYLEEQIGYLRAHMNCIQKESVVDPLGPQVITLSPSHPSSGCSSNISHTGERRIVCTGGRLLRSDIERTWYIAASSCGSPRGLQLDFSLVVYGYKGECYNVNSGGGTIHAGYGNVAAHALSWLPMCVRSVVTAYIPSSHTSAVITGLILALFSWPFKNAKASN